MLNLKYQSIPFGKMTAAEIVLNAQVLLLKLHVITGWSIPQEELKQILVEEFSKKLIESYALVNMDEMLYAFRNNSTVKDWGKAMNLSLIDEVMQPYLAKRMEVSKIEEQRKMIEYKRPSPPKWVIDCEFACYLQTTINKLPIKI